jgi:2-polyprenyl-3-methyl-5-hydroxy-6-metoxy-1,4-benzoquinol methylase
VKERILVAHLVKSKSEEQRVLSELAPLFNQSCFLLILYSEGEIRSCDHFAVLRPPSNLQDGALHKMALEYGLINKFDMICVIDSGNTPPPAEILCNLRSLETDDSALYASKDSTATGPLGEIFNRCIQAVYSLFLPISLCDIYSAYRIYRVKDIEAIPFALNSDSRKFLIEVTIQLLLSGKRIQEIPSSVPSTQHSYRNVFRTVLDLIEVSLKKRLQKGCLFYDSRFDVAQNNEHYPAKFDFPSSHSYAINSLQSGDKVLLLGSGPSELVAPFRLKSKEVACIDLHIAPELKELCVEAKEMDLNFVSHFESSIPKFDKVFALDIIEHLVSPEKFLNAIRTSPCTAQSRLVLTTPNVAFFTIRLILLLGQFNYGKRGILDMTHTRLFTFASLGRLFRQQGFNILKMEGIPAPFPLAIGRNKFSAILLRLNLPLIRASRGLFSFQIYCEAEPIPTTRQLLEVSRTESSLDGAVENGAQAPFLAPLAGVAPRALGERAKGRLSAIRFIALRNNGRSGSLNYPAEEKHNRVPSQHYSG